MNKKGFVLMETIVVIVVISVALLTLFSSYNKILTKTKTENKYDTSEYIYITKWIKENMKKTIDAIDPIDINTLGNNSNENVQLNFASKIDNNTKTLYGIEKIYIVTNINEFGGKEKYFDAYMIDYIKKLDVTDEEELIIVEYKRPVRNIENYEVVNDTNKNVLYETYISSLRW